MNLAFLSEINYLAVICASFLFFFLGSLWYSVLFKRLWVQEVERHNITMGHASSADLGQKMGCTFVANFLACFCVASLVVLTHATDFHEGLLLGILAAGIALSSLASIFIWQNRSLRLYLIDGGYPVCGLILVSILLTLWR